MTAESKDAELGRRHQLHGVQPVLPVSDVAASAEFFRRILGFEIDFLEGDPPIHGRVKVVGDWGHPIYIHLSLAEPEVVFAPVSQPWGLREFAVREANQHVLRFCAEA